MRYSYLLVDYTFSIANVLQSCVIQLETIPPSSPFEHALVFFDHCRNDKQAFLLSFGAWDSVSLDTGHLPLVLSVPAGLSSLAL